MVDLHQVNTIVATTICTFFAGHPDARIETEEAKLLAKQIIQALEGSGAADFSRQSGERVAPTLQPLSL